MVCTVHHCQLTWRHSPLWRFQILTLVSADPVMTLSLARMIWLFSSSLRIRSSSSISSSLWRKQPFEAQQYFKPVMDKSYICILASYLVATLPGQYAGSAG